MSSHQKVALNYITSCQIKLVFPKHGMLRTNILHPENLPILWPTMEVSMLKLLFTATNMSDLLRKIRTLSSMSSKGQRLKARPLLCLTDLQKHTPHQWLTTTNGNIQQTCIVWPTYEQTQTKHITPKDGYASNLSTTQMISTNNMQIEQRNTCDGVLLSQENVGNKKNYSCLCCHY